MEKICAVYITCANKNEAAKIGKRLVSSRLAACSNIFDHISSFYWWKGKMNEDREAALVTKTRESLLSKVEQMVKKLHSYSNPCIVAFPIIRASKEFQKWVISETNTSISRPK